MNEQYFYSKEFEEKVKKVLINSEEHGRIVIHEWRNFIDYDIVPFIRDLIKENFEDAWKLDLNKPSKTTGGEGK